MNTRRIVGLGLLLLLASTGCQAARNFSSAHPVKRADDPLLCTSEERKRPRDSFATTSIPRQGSVPGKLASMPE